MRGRDAGREYGTRQWAAIDPSVGPVGSWSGGLVTRMDVT